ncbi:PE-PGRS family protein, partial [Mycobacterium mantenii]
MKPLVVAGAVAAAIAAAPAAAADMYVAGPAANS